MKWTKLKLELLPLIIQEVDKVTEKYMNMINEMVFSQSELFSDYLELGESISQRIEEIDNFYEDNFGEPNIMHFEKARIRLKKLLTFTADIFELATNKNEMKSLYLMNRNKFQFYNSFKKRIQEKSKSNARFAQANNNVDLNKNTFRAYNNFANNNNFGNNYIEDDNFQSFHNAKGNNTVSLQEFNYQNNQNNQSQFGNSNVNTASKNISPNKKQVGFNNNNNNNYYYNNTNTSNNNNHLLNNYSPINAKQNKTPFSQNNNQGNFNYNHNVNSVNNPNNSNYNNHNNNYNNYNDNNYTPQSDVFGRLFPQSNRNSNNVSSNSSSYKQVVNSASKSPVSRNRNESGNNRNLHPAKSDQNRVLSAPKIDQSKAAKSRKNVDYELYDFLGNKVPIGNKKFGFDMNELEKQKNSSKL